MFLYRYLACKRGGWISVSQKGSNLIPYFSSYIGERTITQPFLGCASPAMTWIGSSTLEPKYFTPSETSSPSIESVQHLNMRVAYFSNEFPGDDLRDLFRHLHVHSRNKRHPILARFIHEATEALREEVRLLPNALRMLVPPFNTIFGLADHDGLRTGPLGGAIDGVLLCVLQLATLVG
jgi:hypothetical protein